MFTPTKAYASTFTVLACIVLTGCPSMPMMTTAKTIGNGKNEIIIAPGVVGFNAGIVGSKTSSDVGATVTLPDVTLGYRRGIGDSFDLGLTLTGFGRFQIDGKVNFLGNGKNDRFALALDPTLGGVFVGAGSVSGGYVDFGLPLLMDLAVSDNVRFTLGPRYRGTYVFGSGGGTGGSSLLNFAGTGFGAEFILSETVALQPWGTADYLLNAPESNSAKSASVLFTAGLAIKLHF